jgi:hypothetical protein
MQMASSISEQPGGILTSRKEPQQRHDLATDAQHWLSVSSMSLPVRAQFTGHQVLPGVHVRPNSLSTQAYTQ